MQADFVGLSDPVNSERVCLRVDNHYVLAQCMKDQNKSIKPSLRRLNTAGITDAQVPNLVVGMLSRVGVTSRSKSYSVTLIDCP